MENSNLHLKIREERIKQGVSQKELGEMVGLPQQAINRIEQGQRKLDVELFEKLCKALNIKKIGSFTVNFISSYYETDVGTDPICPVDDLEDEPPTDSSLSYNNSYSFASSEEEVQENSQIEFTRKKDDNIHKYDGSIRVNHSLSPKAIENLQEINAIRKKIENNEKLSENDLQILKDYNLRQELTMKRLKASLQTMQKALMPLLGLQSAYDMLNELGKKEAVKRIEELTEIPRYTNPDEPPQE